MLYKTIITEPKWKCYIMLGKEPVFSKEECEQIIKLGKSLPQEDAKIYKETQEDAKTYKETQEGKKDYTIRQTDISWIPFERMPKMYARLVEWGLRFNNNYFGFDGLQLGEPAQFTQYSQRHHYDWHSDSAYDMEHQPRVRKLTMVTLLSDPKDFTGGELQLINDKEMYSLKQGYAIFFASFIAHRVLPIKTGTRISMPIWFNGPPLK